MTPPGKPINGAQVFAAMRGSWIFAALALTGLIAAALPVFVPIGSDFWNAVQFAAPFVGAAAWSWFLVRLLARGYVSGGALIVVGLLIYVAAALTTISISMMLGAGGL